MIQLRCSYAANQNSLIWDRFSASCHTMVTGIEQDICETVGAVHPIIFLIDHWKAMKSLGPRKVMVENLEALIVPQCFAMPGMPCWFYELASWNWCVWCQSFKHFTDIDMLIYLSLPWCKSTVVTSITSPSSSWKTCHGFFSGSFWESLLCPGSPVSFLCSIADSSSRGLAVSIASKSLASFWGPGLWKFWEPIRILILKLQSFLGCWLWRRHC